MKKKEFSKPEIIDKIGGRLEVVTGRQVGRLPTSGDGLCNLLLIIMHVS